jgi:hypothetical protein
VRESGGAMSVIALVSTSDYTVLIPSSEYNYLHFERRLTM